MKDKKANIGAGALNIAMGVIGVLVALVVVAYLAGALLPTAQTALTNVSNSGAPLANSLFGSSGIVMIIVVIAIFLSIIIMAFNMVKSKHKK